MSLICVRDATVTVYSVLAYCIPVYFAILIG